MTGSVGVLITSYNQESLLRQAIESVLNQTVQPDKIIIVDDASEDDSRSMIQSYKNRYPKIIEPIFNDRNYGVTVSRRMAFSRFETRYVTYLDGDDLFSPEKIEKELDHIKKKGTEIVYSDNYYIDQQNNILGTWAGDEHVPEGNVFKETFARDFPRRSLFRMEMVEREAWEKIGFHDQALSIYEDFDMRIRLTKECRTSYLNIPLSSIRLNTDGLSKRPPIEHVAALHFIFGKNKDLLNDLSLKDARYCRKMYSEWILIVIRSALKQARKQKALKDYVNMQLKQYQYLVRALWNWI